MLRLVVIIILEMMMITMQDKCDYNIIINTHTHTHTHTQLSFHQRLKPIEGDGVSACCTISRC